MTKFRQLVDRFMMVELTPEEYFKIVLYISSRVRLPARTKSAQEDFMDLFERLVELKSLHD